MPAEASNSESEFALAICAAEPRLLAEEIAGLTMIADYRLAEPADLTLHDVYWDLPSRTLGRHHIALRLRTDAEGVWLTLKGRAEAQNGDLPRRMEREVPWSREALNGVLADLQEAGIEAPQPAPGAELGRPRDVLQGLGFRIVQDRTTRRQRRYVVSASADQGPVLAELAIDSTRYRLDGLAVTHDEVEIEVKSAGGAAAVGALVADLQARYGESLRPWNYGKLPTGSAIQALYSASALTDLIGEDGALKAEAYDLLEAELQRSA